MKLDSPFFRNKLRRTRSFARRRTLDAISVLGRVEQRWERQKTTPRIQIVLLHDLPEGSVNRFRRLLSILQEYYTFVSYSEAVERIVTGRVDRPVLAFSFDDGLRDCMRAAALLEEFGTCGMFFVCPDLVEADPEQRATFCRERLWIEPTEFLSWSEIDALHRRGHEFGSHTMSHVNLARTERARIAHEVATSKNKIADRLGACRHFAWPYGRFSHFNQDARSALVQIGFDSCASGERGSHSRHNETPCMPCVRRESIDVQWPLRHIKHFLVQGSRRPILPSQSWPSSWDCDEDTLRRAA